LPLKPFLHELRRTLLLSRAVSIHSLLSRGHVGRGSAGPLLGRLIPKAFGLRDKLLGFLSGRRPLLSLVLKPLSLSAESVRGFYRVLVSTERRADEEGANHHQNKAPTHRNLLSVPLKG
jgi:hypothetical protein